LIEEVIEGNSLIKFRRLSIRMIANAWQVFKTFVVEEKKRDLLNEIVDYLENNYNIPIKISKNELIQKLEEIYYQDDKLKKLCKKLLLLYVPYRFLSPFFPEISGINDTLKNQEIEKKSRETPNVLYKIDSEHEVIYMNKFWFDFILENKDYISKLIYQKLSEYYNFDFEYSILLKTDQEVKPNQYKYENNESNFEQIPNDFNNLFGEEIVDDYVITPNKLRDFMRGFVDFYKKFRLKTEKSKYEKIKEMFLKDDIDILMEKISKRHLKIVLKIYKNEQVLREKILDFINVQKFNFKNTIEDEYQNSFFTDEDLKEIIFKLFNDSHQIYKDDPIKQLIDSIETEEDLDAILKKMKIKNEKLRTFIEKSFNAYRQPSNIESIKQFVEFLKDFIYFKQYESLILKIFERHLLTVEEFYFGFLELVFKLNGLENYNFSDVENVALLLKKLGLSEMATIKVKKYLLKRGIEEFFKKDNERMQFWKNYIDRMINVKLKDYYSTKAIIMYFYKYDIVEFEDKGNALYIYEKGVVDGLFDLKDRFKCYERFLHSGSWQIRLKQRLKELGI
jgi:hypothetical protein